MDVLTSTAPLGILTTGAGDSIVVALDGELDVTTIAGFRDAVDGALRSSVDRVDVDLASLRFVDAAGVGVLVGARRRAAEAGIVLRVRNAGAQVLQVLEMTRLADYLGGADDTASTIDSSR